MATEITCCRICGNRELAPILSLGNHALTGVFPRRRAQPIATAPLELVKCWQRDDDRACGLVQLRHTCDLREMYGPNYGYQSALNQSMVDHLRQIVAGIMARVRLAPGDFVIDIGSNDGTLLKSFPHDPGRGPKLIGIDPIGAKFAEHYPDHISLIPEFFPAASARDHFGSKKARVITSIAVFYDLESPLEFMTEVRDLLADDGVWVMEQSYLPSMLQANAYDTIVHEHLEYYALGQIRWLAERVGLDIIDVQRNATNGGSFCVTMARRGSGHVANEAAVASLLEKEERGGLATMAPFEAFQRRVARHRDELRAFVEAARRDGKLLLGYGASTKGNVLLQYCGFTERDIPCIAEVNPDKFGCFTPETLIPIVPEADARRQRPDYFLVFPWHFRDNIVAREAAYLDGGGTLIMPLPGIELIKRPARARSAVPQTS